MSLKYAKKRSGNFLFLRAKSVVLTVAKQIIHHWKALVMANIMKVEIKKALFNFASKKFISGRTLILSKFLCLMNEILIISTNCYLYDTVSNLSVRSAKSELAQLTPRHSPHAVEHGKPCFLQLHLKFTQPLLQLHRIVNSKSAGAYIKSMDFGINLPSISFHPHRSGSISSPFPFHSLIW